MIYKRAGLCLIEALLGFPDSYIKPKSGTVGRALQVGEEYKLFCC